MLHLRLHTAVIICWRKVISLHDHVSMFSFLLHPAKTPRCTRQLKIRFIRNCRSLTEMHWMPHVFCLVVRAMLYGTKAVFPLRTGLHWWSQTVTFRRDSVTAQCLAWLESWSSVLVWLRKVIRSFWKKQQNANRRYRMKNWKQSGTVPANSEKK